MEISNWKVGILNRIGKYKYVLVVILAGILLMMIPERKVTSQQSVQLETDVAKDNTQDNLAQILALIQGVGKVEVYLSVDQGECTIYQTDSTYSESDGKRDSKSQTILVTDSDRNETGLIYQKNPPSYLGAIVVAQGADDPKVKLALVDAVTKVTGLGADKISVLKMK